MRTAARYLAMTRRQSRRSFLGWLVAIAALSALYVASYKTVGGVKGGAVSRYPAALRRALNLQDLTSSSGYLATTVFGIPLLVLLTIYVVSTAMHSPAGEEESGSLDLTLSYPLTRRVLVLVETASMAISVALMGVVVLAVTLALRSPAGLSIRASDLAATCLMFTLLGWCLGCLTLLISAASGQRSMTLGVSVVVALVAYLTDSFLPLVDHLGWVHEISPYYWFAGGDPLRNGLSGSHCVLLLLVTAAATAAAVVAFDRRDLRV